MNVPHVIGSRPGSCGCPCPVSPQQTHSAAQFSSPAVITGAPGDQVNSEGRAVSYIYLRGELRVFQRARELQCRGKGGVPFPSELLGTTEAAWLSRSPSSPLLSGP